MERIVIIKGKSKMTDDETWIKSILIDYILKHIN